MAKATDPGNILEQFGVGACDSAFENNCAFWKISLQEEGKTWVHYDISKTDYKKAEQYIRFLFNSQSYLVDVIEKDQA